MSFADLFRRRPAATPAREHLRHPLLRRALETYHPTLVRVLRDPEAHDRLAKAVDGLIAQKGWGQLGDGHILALLWEHRDEILQFALAIAKALGWLAL